MEATCAKCGQIKELCESTRIDGIKQPRFCKDCILEYISSGELNYIDKYWIIQLKQLDDKETINNLMKENKSA